MEPNREVRKYFVTVHAPTVEALQQLRGRGLDLFRASAVRAAVALRAAQARARAKRVEIAPPGIEGLLTIEEVERLVQDGYRVTLEQTASRRARAKAIDFDEWLAGMEG